VGCGAVHGTAAVKAPLAVAVSTPNSFVDAVGMSPGDAFSAMGASSTPLQSQLQDIIDGEDSAGWLDEMAAIVSEGMVAAAAAASPSPLVALMPTGKGGGSGFLEKGVWHGMGHQLSGQLPEGKGAVVGCCASQQQWQQQANGRGGREAMERPGAGKGQSRGGMGCLGCEDENDWESWLPSVIP
jgi:hypothetical protein